jgi:hypothetical protein
MYFIQDLLDNQGNIVKKDYLENKFQCKFVGLDYESLIHALPKHWVKIIIHDNRSNQFILYRDCTLYLDNKLVKLNEMKARDIYWEMLKTDRATSENTWKECNNIDLSEEAWEEIYLLTYKLTMDTRIIAFQFKVTHRILACNEKMYTWKVCDTKLCHCDHLDTIEHYLVLCQAVDTFWKQLFNWWANVTEISIPSQTYEIIYGLPNPNNDPVILHYNYVILQAKYYI